MATDTLQPCPTCGHPSDHEPGCPDDGRAPANDDVATAPTGTEPWVIPIRAPDPGIPQRAATWIDRMPVLPLAVAAVALFALVVGAVVVMSDSADPDDPEVAGSEVAQDASTSRSPAAEEPSTPTTATTATTRAPSTTAAPSTSAAAGLATGADEASPDTVVPEPADLPILDPAVLSPGWVAQVSSVPSSAGGNALTTSYETVTEHMPEAVIVRGSEWPSLRDGFWVIVQPGFDSGAEAIDACEAAGRVGRDDCVGRYLDPSDGTERVCAREPDGTLRGAC